MNKDELEKLKKLPFEKALEELESVVAKMESGNLPLDKMMESFERGKILTAICGDKLKSVERKIEVLRSKSGNGEWVDSNRTAKRRSNLRLASPSRSFSDPPPRPRPGGERFLGIAVWQGDRNDTDTIRI